MKQLQTLRSFIITHDGILYVLLDLSFCLIAVALATVYGLGFGVVLAGSVFGTYHLLRFVVYTVTNKFQGKWWLTILYLIIAIAPLLCGIFVGGIVARVLLWSSIILAVLMFLRDTTRPDYPDDMHVD
jgi:hypothetical protein